MMTIGEGAAMYGQQSVSGRKKPGGQWEMLVFIFVDVDSNTVTGGIGSRGGKMRAETLLDSILK